MRHPGRLNWERAGNLTVDTDGSQIRLGLIFQRERSKGESITITSDTILQNLGLIEVA